MELVVFDLAGTTVQDQDGLVARAFLSVAETHGIRTTAEEISSLRGRSKIEVFRLLLSREARSGDLKQQAVAAHTDFQRLLLDSYEQNCPPIDGAADTFRFLKSRGIKVAVDSGFDRLIMGAVLRSVGWLRDGLIDAAISVEDVPVGRPAPYMIFKAMVDLRILDVRTVVKVGDTPVDLHEGTNAGCKAVIGVLTGASDALMLGRHRHTHIISGVKQLPELMRQEGWIED